MSNKTMYNEREIGGGGFCLPHQCCGKCQTTALETTEDGGCLKFSMACILLVLPNYFDYVLYDKENYDGKLKEKIIELLKMRLPVCRRPENIGGAFAVYVENMTKGQLQTALQSLKQDIEGIFLPLSLPIYLQKIEVVTAIAYSPPLPKEFLLKSLLCHYFNRVKTEQNQDLPISDNQALRLQCSHSKQLSAFTETMLNLSCSAAEQLDFSPKEKADFKLAAIWQNIGLTKIPREIFLKPSPLTIQEKQMMNDHVGVSCHLARVSGVPERVCGIIGAHHERIDGRGYPYQLYGKEIDPKAQLLHLINDYAGLRTDWPWRNAIRREYALSAISNRVGRKYSAEVFADFLQTLKL